MRRFKVLQKEVAYRDILVTAENPEEAKQWVLDLEPEQYEEYIVQEVDIEVSDCVEVEVEQ